MQVKKWFLSLVVLFIGLGASAVSAAPVIMEWGSANYFGKPGNVVYTNGSAILAGTQWLVELVNIHDGSVLLVETNGFENVGTFFTYADVDPAWDGLEVKTIIYDAGTKEEALFYAEFSNQEVLEIPLMPFPGQEPRFNAGAVTAADWRLIPVDPDEWTASEPVLNIRNQSGTNLFEYVYTRRKDASARGITYTLQTCTNLGSGVWVSTVGMETDSGSLDSVYESVTNQVSDGSESSLYIRLLMEASAD